MLALRCPKMTKNHPSHCITIRLGELFYRSELVETFQDLDPGTFGPTLCGLRAAPGPNPKMFRQAPIDKRAPRDGRECSETGDFWSFLDIEVPTLHAHFGT